MNKQAIYTKHSLFKSIKVADSKNFENPSFQEIVSLSFHLHARA